jgi:Fe-S-cluster containining protein
MDVEDPGSSPPLVRRTVEQGRVREFLHTGDGSPALERPVGEVEALPATTAEPQPPAAAGQLVWQRVSVENRDLPLHLPLFRAACNGSGACCSLHHHVPVTEPERSVITAVMGSGWESPVPFELLLHRAYDSGGDSSFNIASVGGTCAFQRGDGLCELHCRGGPMAKPMACRSFPSSLVLCGGEWHASLRPECACIQRTAIEGGDLHMDADSWVALRNFQEWVASVPEELRLDEQRTIARERYLSWMRGVVAELRTSFEPVAVLRRALRGLDEEAGEDDEYVDARPPQAWLDGVVLWLRRWVDSLGPAYSDASPYAIGLRWALDVSQQLAADDSIRAPSWSQGRSRDWSRRQASLAGLFVHGHGLLEQRHLVPAVRDMGHLCWLARASTGVRPVADLDQRLESCTLWMFFRRTLDGR